MIDSLNLSSPTQVGYKYNFHLILLLDAFVVANIFFCTTGLYPEVFGLLGSDTLDEGLAELLSINLN